MKNRSGNALFLVLIAITLFAALTFAVSSSGGGGEGLQREKTQMTAADIRTYGALMANTVQQMVVTGGCLDTQISFANDSDGDGEWTDADDDLNNPNAPADGRCHVFHPNGGAMQTFDLTGLIDTSQSAERFYGNIYVSSDLCIDGVGSRHDNCQTGNASVVDLILFFPYLQQDVCLALNQGKADTIPNEYNEFYFADGEFVGTYTMRSRLATNPFSNDGMSSLCLEGGSNGAAIPPPGTYHYYQVLLAR